MTKAICEVLDRLESKQARNCDSGCKNYMFDHRDYACVLSEVFAVKINHPCFIYEIKLENNQEGEKE